MTWLQRYRIRHYIENSVWIFPALSTLAAIAVVRLLHIIETHRGWQSAIDPGTATAVLGTLASALFTTIVFICSALLVAVQLASAALTPRIIGVVFRDPVTKFSLTLLVFAFTFCLGALLRIKETVPFLTTYIAAYTCMVCLAVFFYLIDHLGKVLRPSGALRAVAWLGRQVVDRVYPRHRGESVGTTATDVARMLSGKPALTVPNPTDGVVLAFDEAGLLSLAQRADCVIEMVPQVGDHVAVGDPLFRVYQPGTAVAPEAMCHTLCQSIAVGQERTLEQDPTFPFRIMVDIASKALSPAINDPTTAVIALDQIHHLLRTVGERNLDTGNVRDASGRLRLIYRTPDWEDFVHLAVTEIRQFGCESIQVARRLRAMLESLIQALPEVRAPLLRRELALLNRSAERFFSDPEDRELAAVSDFQGVGGKPEQKKETVTDSRSPSSQQSEGSVPARSADGS
jgi:uncharacterized membrane protein